jgi:hypothetical protein
MEKKLKRRQGVEGKTRISREESSSQEDESDKPLDLKFIHLTSQSNTKNCLELFC